MELLLTIAGGTVVVLSIAMAGRLIAPGVRLPAGVRFSTGAVGVSLLVFLLLAMHAGYWFVFAGIPVVLWAAGRAPISNRRAGCQPAPQSSAAATARTSRPQLRVFLKRCWELNAAIAACPGRSLCCLAGLVYFIYALAPEIQADAAGYHLRLVAGYVRAHGLTARTGFYDVLPQGMEMLFVPAFALGTWSSAKLVHFAFFVATVPLVRELAKEAGLDDFQGWAAAAIFFLAPVCAVAGTSAYTDAGLVCACCSVVYLLVRWNRERLPMLLICAAVNAGFCYAVKPTFGWIAVCGVVFVAVRSRSLKAVLVLSSVTLACIAPWLIRAWQLSGSVAAPFLSRWMPNRVLTPDVEQHLTAQFSAFRPSFSWSHAWLGYTLFGDNQGIFGPAFLLLPMALLLLIKPRRRWLPFCSVLLAVPFLFNTGARFLMPALALGALAVVSVLPRRAVWAVIAVQAIAALPPVLDYYDHGGDWRLGSLPLAAALRIEPENHYLRRSVPGFAAAEMIAKNTPEGAKVLACTALPEAYIPRETTTWWHSRRAQQFADAIHFAMMSQGTRARLVSWRWREENQYRLLRMTALSDLRLVSAAVPNAGPGVNSWRMYRPGETFSVRTPPGVNGVDFLIWPGDQAVEKTEVQPESGSWRSPEGMVERSVCYIDVRRDATAYIRRAGYNYIAVPVANDAFAEIGVDMVRHPSEWGVSIAGEASGLYLLKIGSDLF